MTTETTQPTSRSAHAQLINTVADTIARAMQHGRQLPASLAVALDDARLLQSPETAAQLEHFQLEHQRLLRWHAEDTKAITKTRERAERQRVRLAAAEADLLNMRGLLSPAGEPRRIPPRSKSTSGLPPPSNGS